MIHNVTQLVKFKKLQRRLGITKRRELVGLLESLWHLTIREAPDGALGKLDNETIAIELEWDGDPDELVAALVETNWLDRCHENRLLVHDWHEHAPKFVKGFLARHKRSVAISSEQAAIASCPEQAALSKQVPNLTKPNLTKPNPPGGSGGIDFSGGKGKTDPRIGSVLSEAHLRDNEALDSWYRWHAQRSDRLVDPTPEGRLLVFGAAVRAIAIGKQPLKLFKHIVLRQEWGLISESQLDQARLRLRAT